MPTSSVLFRHDELYRARNWLLILGILLVLLGTAVVMFPLWPTLIAVFYYGWTLLIGAVLHTVSLLYTRRWEGFGLHLVSALLDFVVGLLLISDPFRMAGVLTFLIAILLLVGGLFRAITSVFLQYPNWGWSVFSGLIAMLLGLALLNRWPYDSLWFIGMCIGVNFIVQGWSLVMFSLVVRVKPV